MGHGHTVISTLIPTQGVDFFFFLSENRIACGATGASHQPEGFP